MIKPDATSSIDEYLAAIDEPRKSEVEQLHRLIKRFVPELKPHMMDGMIAYGTYHYEYATGREGDTGIISLASQKNYISVYVCAADKKGYLAERYKTKLPKADIGKSCVRFKKLADVDIGILMEIVKKGAEMMASKVDR